MVSPAGETSVMSKQRGSREHRVGTVVSDKSDKSIRVRCDYVVRHPKYGKYYKRATTLHSHDEENKAKVGDVVEVMACRRMSKTKCWRLTRIVRSAS
jgi:small subunit ribosomal protein S17